MKSLLSDLRKLSNPDKVKTYKNFHKTGYGYYAEGDLFLGVTVPQVRSIAKKYSGSGFNIIKNLLNSKFHEERYLAFEILVEKYKKSENKKEIVDFYLKNAKKANGWDLVDTSAPYILGDFLLDKNKSILYELAKSNNLWEKRIAIVSTYAFIKNNKFNDALNISEMLLDDEHDLIHKAVGWMLREVGKRDEKVLERFLKDNYPKLPRTTLRYAIERFPENKRKAFLEGRI